MRNIPPKPPVSMLFQPLLPNKRHEKSGQEMLCFLLAFFCTLYGNYPISVCWLILVAIKYGIMPQYLSITSGSPATAFSMASIVVMWRKRHGNTLPYTYPISVCWLILVYEQLPVHSSLFMRLSSLACTCLLRPVLQQQLFQWLQ